MPLRRLETRVIVKAPREAVFRWVGDHRNAGRALEGVREWQPLDPARVSGVGARFRVRVALFGVTAETVLVLDRWEEPSTIGWHADGGPLQVRGSWSFLRHPSGTEVLLRIDYEPPGGVLGAFGAGRLAGLARRRLDTGLDVLREAVEAPRS